MVVNLCGDQIYVDFIRFLIREYLYAWCLRYNVCSTWFLDIRVSTYYVYILLSPGDYLILGFICSTLVTKLFNSSIMLSKFLL